ncbi:hypothetical protein PR048_000393 [Dryococelus australis]|uniref:DDE-1 domain-containing protein n=1 Tax=Dryococelus australis TaxID=614101 RepID=A0ABQ9IEG5_9NEOP|nr:hypothetical protein PR048_000393 [Dryococelus australis]
MTVLITANADGQLAPALVVYAYEHIPSSKTEKVPEHFGIGKSKLVWMCAPTFYQYITNIFNPLVTEMKLQRPVIYFFDGHASHMTLNLSEFCLENGIHLLALYPNPTYLMQPMDVSVFRPLKAYWKKEVYTWRLQNGVFLEICEPCQVLQVVGDIQHVMQELKPTCFQLAEHLLRAGDAAAASSGETLRESRGWSEGRGREGCSHRWGLLGQPHPAGAGASLRAAPPQVLPPAPNIRVALPCTSGRLCGPSASPLGPSHHCRSNIPAYTQLLASHASSPDAASAVGSHLASLESVNRNTTSWLDINSNNLSKSSLAANALGVSPPPSLLSGPIGCPGIRIVRVTPFETTQGLISRRASAAITAFDVICNTPHDSKSRATEHPKVPAPSSKQRVFFKISKSSSGSKRHFISLRLRSTDVPTSCLGSMLLARSARRGPYLPRSFRSQPTHCILPLASSTPGKSTLHTMLVAVLQLRPSRVSLRLTNSTADPTRSGCRCTSRAIRFLTGQPGLHGDEQGSQKPTNPHLLVLNSFSGCNFNPGARVSIKQLSCSQLAMLFTCSCREATSASDSTSCNHRGCETSLRPVANSLTSPSPSQLLFHSLPELTNPSPDTNSSLNTFHSLTDVTSMDCLPRSVLLHTL